MQKYGFYFDMTRCLGCKACQIACKDKHDLLIGVNFREVKTFERGSYPSIECYHYSFACNHCEKPMCVRSCPTGAMHISKDKTIQYDEGICIRCRYCITGCPYGIPKYVEEKRIGKCDACIDLRNEGKEPACVNACIMNCLEWGTLETMRQKYSNAVSDIAILPPSDKTKPSLLILPKKSALKS